ncbi:hypothetical protein [uncultured Winogradskyella sp.]|uniref:hypothetical protein n=1 Tax=uncultured Winogradskyella sp. TaxID=395353 RepID=UPI002639EDCB|nr:hypothetical protein [uncultured Winogradskyella sp.]
MKNLKIKIFVYFTFIISLLNCSGIATERLLLNDVNSDSSNISEKYWLVYAIDDKGNEKSGMTFKFNSAGVFNKSKIWVGEMEGPNFNEKVYIRLKESKVKNKFIVQATMWNEKGKSETGLGILIIKSSKEYHLYMPSKSGYDLAKNSAKLKKMENYYSVETGQDGLIKFKSQAVELYSKDIIEFLESMNLNIDLKLSAIFRASDEKNYKSTLEKIKKSN